MFFCKSISKAALFITLSSLISACVSTAPKKNDDIISTDSIDAQSIVDNPSRFMELKSVSQAVYDMPDQDDRCYAESLNKLMQQNPEYIVQTLGDKISQLEESPFKVHKSILDVKTDANGGLLIQGEVKSGYRNFNGNIIRITERIAYEPTKAQAHVARQKSLIVGLLYRNKNRDMALGCAVYRTYGFYIDKRNSSVVGSLRWKTENIDLDYKVTAYGESYDLKKEQGTHQNQGYLRHDFSSVVRETKNSDDSKFIVTCLDCAKTKAGK